uniref:Uncharacterized protein n=1 Tax=Anguilla anguilla TaxID=7936 RepID=A0A0E9TNZ4_ANGAN
MGKEAKDCRFDPYTTLPLYP